MGVRLGFAALWTACLSQGGVKFLVLHISRSAVYRRKGSLFSTWRAVEPKLHRTLRRGCYAVLGCCVFGNCYRRRGAGFWWHRRGGDGHCENSLLHISDSVGI